MNRYPLTLRDRLRFRFGLLWAAHLPTLTDLRRWVTGLFYAAMLLLCIGYAHNTQYAEEMAAEAEAQAHDNRALTAALALCVAEWSATEERPATTYPMQQEDI